MDVPLEIAYRGLEKNEAAERLIREKVNKLTEVHGHIVSCRVVVEERHKHQHTGNPYLVRVECTVPSGHFIVAERVSAKEEREQPLLSTIRYAFEAARRQLEELAQKQRYDVKMHPEQQIMAFVSKILRDEGYGFLRTVDERDVYFHKNSVLHDEWERLDIGTGVRFSEEMGEKGPQATSVEIVDKPGARLDETGQPK